MRYPFSQILVLGCMVLVTGCMRSSPVTSAATNSASEAEAAAEPSRPHFESELTQTHAVNDGKGSGTHRSTRLIDGKMFRVIDDHTATIGSPTGAVSIRYNVKFADHRNGKDIYKVSYTVRKDGSEQTATHEVDYEGKRLVLIEDEYCTVILQPPTAAPAADGDRGTEPGSADDGGNM